MVTLNYDSDLPVQYIPIQAITIPVITGGNVPMTGDCLLCGYSFIEATGTASATIQIFDGADATGGLMATIALSPGQCVNDALPFPGLYCTRGVFVRMTSGSASGAVWVRDV